MRLAKASLKYKTFEELGLLPGLIKVLKSKEIIQPTAIQSMSIPQLLKNDSHTLIAAQTGTGKTLSYALPLFHLLKAQELESQKILTEKNSPRAVIIVPNRELSKQCELVLSLFKHEIRLKTFSLHSGQKWKTECTGLEQGVDILIGTPDKIDKHRKQNTLNFSKVTNMIIDESDTLIDAGFSKHLDLYFQELRNTAKLAFVSATFSLPLERFITDRFAYAENQKKPFIQKIIEEKTHLNLTHLKHEFVQLQEYDKNPLFEKMLFDVNSMMGNGGCIIFCNSIQSVRAVEYLVNEKGMKAVSLHGDIPPKRRSDNIAAFNNREAKFLVCTDLGSRGLDFPFVNYVLQFDFPKTQSDYVHRAGRAGRAGRPGSVITFYRKSDIPVVQEFKKSYEKSQPLRMSSSAYSLKNKHFLLKSTPNIKTKPSNSLHEDND